MIRDPADGWTAKDLRMVMHWRPASRTSQLCRACEARDKHMTCSVNPCETHELFVALTSGKKPRTSGRSDESETEEKCISRCPQMTGYPAVSLDEERICSILKTHQGHHIYVLNRFTLKLKNSTKN